MLVCNEALLNPWKKTFADCTHRLRLKIAFWVWKMAFSVWTFEASLRKKKTPACLMFKHLNPRFYDSILLVWTLLFCCHGFIFQWVILFYVQHFLSHSGHVPAFVNGHAICIFRLPKGPCFRLLRLFLSLGSEVHLDGDQFFQTQFQNRYMDPGMSQHVHLLLPFFFLLFFVSMQFCGYFRVECNQLRY